MAAMTTPLREALDRRDAAAIIEALEDEPRLAATDTDVIDAWAWIEPTSSAGACARTLLRALHASFPTVQPPAGWVRKVGLAVAERAMETVDDADGPTRIYGTLLTLDLGDDVALERWLEQVVEGDGYFDPDSLHRAHNERFQPNAPAERRQLLRGIETLVSFSLNVEHYDRAEALEYLARDLRSAHAPVSAHALAEAMRRLEAVPELRLPTVDELAAARAG